VGRYPFSLVAFLHEGAAFLFFGGEGGGGLWAQAGRFPRGTFDFSDFRDGPAGGGPGPTKRGFEAPSGGGGGGTGGGGTGGPPLKRVCFWLGLWGGGDGESGVKGGAGGGPVFSGGFLLGAGPWGVGTPRGLPTPVKGGFRLLYFCRWEVGLAREERKDGDGQSTGGGGGDLG